MKNDTDPYWHMYHSSGTYLRLSHVYAEYLGGLRWSNTEDALIHSDGAFFAFSAVVAEFVDGFVSQGPVPLFGYLLHWMDLVQNQRDLPVPVIRLLRKVFYETGADWRNAGAFAAMLSKDIPEVPVPPDMEMVSKRLRDHSFPIRWFTSQFHELQQPPEQPPIAPEKFERDVIRKLEACTEEEMRTWLQTGRGPIKDAERLVPEPPQPRSLARALASLLDRPRLAGAHTYAPQFIGALTLPPRRLTPQELPVGGYTDIVTRGQIEHVLPAQFALDEIEFLRRFAEKELLYFRREEPPIQNRQEMVVLLDQGVRTWGDVRLVLTAAALALGRQALLRKTPFYLAATSTEGLIVDPSKEDEELLGELVEASDLSLNPGLALERVLETPSEVLRDVVLLTHPRNLRESDVLSAARRLGASDRLFAVTLDAHGHAELSEVRRGTALSLRQFHIDFVPSQPKPRRPERGSSALGQQWTGDVEPMPFPFRLGTEPQITHCEFDDDTQWLLTVSGQGSLHLWKLDGSSCEMLPRPCTDKVLKEVIGVIGVAGGFAILGKIGEVLRLAHYDIIRRCCKLYELGPGPSTGISLRYGREFHRVIWTGAWESNSHSLDLGQHNLSRIPILDASASPTDFVASHGKQRHLALIRMDQMSAALSVDEDFCAFDPDQGAFVVLPRKGKSMAFTPTSEGKPCFQLAILRDAQLQGNTLSIGASRRDLAESITLVRCPEGAILHEYAVRRPKHKIIRHLLSNDGSRIALQRSDQRVEIDAFLDRTLPTWCTRPGGYTMDSRFYVGDQCLLINLGTSRQLWHLFDWANGKLTHYHKRQVVRAHDPLTIERELSLTHRFSKAVLTAGASSPLPLCCQSDPKRYTAGIRQRHLWFVLDRFGQVMVLDENETLLAMFIAFREHYAAWLPDGTRLGSPTLSFGPATPQAAEKIGRALCDAETLARECAKTAEFRVVS